MLACSVNPDNATRFAADIYTEYGSFIRKIIRYHLKDECCVDDIFQGFFLHLIVSPIPNDLEHVESYLHRTVVNCIMEHGQQIRRYQAYVDRYAANTSIVEVENDPENTIIQAEETAKMFTLIRKQLTHKEYLAITLRYRENRNVYEIAMAMDVKTNSVNRYISRGLKKLRDSSLLKEIFVVNRTSQFSNRKSSTFESTAQNSYSIAI